MEKYIAQCQKMIFRNIKIINYCMLKSDTQRCLEISAKIFKCQKNNIHEYYFMGVILHWPILQFDIGRYPCGTWVLTHC